MSHREDLQSYFLNLLLQSQSPNLKMSLQREGRYPKGKEGKLMLARLGMTPLNRDAKTDQTQKADGIRDAK
ncbi:unnamed protein product [Gulo gulo]|uniref:Uncharacterized protein n=1 Tax=Gulo gulo TaxID=48420 RepID=A0A9X9Q4B7_GULGU|nr:unnamed protein product [Gulo gulo]